MNCLMKLAAVSCVLGLGACGDDGGESADIDASVDTVADASVDAEPGSAPLAPDGLAGEVTAANTVTLTWNDNSDDELGFNVERRDAGSSAFAQLASVDSDAATYVDSAAPNHSVEYRVVAHNDTGETPSNLAFVALDVAAQSASLSVDLTTLVVTVGGAGTAIPLSVVGNATWAGVGNDMTISLTGENKTGRLLFNLKALISNINDTAATVTGDGQYDSMPYVHFGANALDLDLTATKDLVIAGITGDNDPLTVDVEFVNHPMLFTNDSYYDTQLRLMDTSGVGEVGSLQVNHFGGAGHNNTPIATYSGLTWSARSPDGRHVYFGVRNQPMLVTLDTLTMTLTGGADLTGADNIKHDSDGSGSFGYTRGVTISPDGLYLYVTLSTGSHMYEASAGQEGKLELVKIERATMDIMGRVVLYESIAESSPTRVSLSADGSRGAVATRHYYDQAAGDAQSDGKIFVFNTEDMSIVDGDFADGDQGAPFDLSSIGNSIRRIAISPDGSTLYAGFYDTVGHDIQVLDIATGTLSKITPPTVTVQDVTDVFGNSHYYTELDFQPDGRLYLSEYYDGLAIYDPSDTTWVTMIPGGGGRSIEFSGDRSYYLLLDEDGSATAKIDASTDMPMAFPAAGGMTASFPSDTHAAIMTPF